MGITLLILTTIILIGCSYAVHALTAGAKSKKSTAQITGPISRLFIDRGTMSFSTRHFEKAVAIQSIVILLSISTIALANTHNRGIAPALISLFALTTAIIFVWQTFKGGTNR